MYSKSRRNRKKRRNRTRNGNRRRERNKIKKMKWKRNRTRKMQMKRMRIKIISFFSVFILFVRLFVRLLVFEVVSLTHIVADHTSPFTAAVIGIPHCWISQSSSDFSVPLQLNSLIHTGLLA